MYMYFVLNVEKFFVVYPTVMTAELSAVAGSTNRQGIRL